MSSKEALLDILSDGNFHSGATLAKQFSMTRAGIWKIIKSLQAENIEIQTFPRRGYQIPGGLELLSKATLNQKVPEFKVFHTIDSTNLYLLNHPEFKSGSVCAAEQQTAGRGRRGRHWISPFAKNLYFSIVWEFASGPSTLAGLSLAVAVSIVERLREEGISDLAVKWPNDIYLQGQKVAGILIEMSGEVQGPTRVVIGVGLNVQMPAECMREVTQAWTDLESHTSIPLSRNQILSGLVTALQDGLTLFNLHGFSGFRDLWQQYDFLVQCPIRIDHDNKTEFGVALGVTDQGLLRVLINNAERELNGGEVSVRSQRPSDHSSEIYR